MSSIEFAILLPAVGETPKRKLQSLSAAIACEMEFFVLWQPFVLQRGPAALAHTHCMLR